MALRAEICAARCSVLQCAVGCCGVLQKRHVYAKRDLRSIMEMCWWRRKKENLKETYRHEK